MTLFETSISKIPQYSQLARAIIRVTVPPAKNGRRWQATVRHNHIVCGFDNKLLMFETSSFEPRIAALLHQASGALYQCHSRELSGRLGELDNFGPFEISHLRNTDVIPTADRHRFRH